MPDAPFWVGKETRAGEEGLPPSMTERKTSPPGAPDQVMAVGWLQAELGEETRVAIKISQTGSTQTQQRSAHSPLYERGRALDGSSEGCIDGC